MEKQKYFRGNLLRLKWGHKIWSAKSNRKERPEHVLSEDETVYFIDISPELMGKEVVIKGSYGDLYGEAGSGGGYSVAFLDGSNEVAWIEENQMDFIEVGGEHLFQTINENKHQRRLEKSIVVLEVLEDKSSGSGQLYKIKTNKPMIKDRLYTGRYDFKSPYVCTYRVISKKGNTHIVAPIRTFEKGCVLYFDERPIQ
jgi:hypothetical protein